MGHRHKSKRFRDEAFGGAVSVKQNEAAHGNITRVHSCACGATKRDNINGRHIERGSWNEAGDFDRARGEYRS